MSFNFKIENQTFQIKEDGFKRIAIINAIGALVIAPLFLFGLYFFSAPIINLNIVASYIICFPLYVAICFLFKKIRTYLLYFIIFHLFVITFISFLNLIQNDFTRIDLIYFFVFFIISILIIQRLYLSLLYYFFTLSMFLYVYASYGKNEEIILFSIGLIVLLSFIGGTIIYSKYRFISNLKNYVSYVKTLLNNYGVGYIIFEIDKKNISVFDYNLEITKFFKIDDKNNVSWFQQIFTENELIDLTNLSYGTKFKKELLLEFYNQKRQISCTVKVLNYYKKRLFITNLEDTTLEKEKTQELLTSEKKYKNLYFKNKAGVFTLNNESRIIDGNESFFVIFERTIEKGTILFTEKYFNDWELITQSINDTGSLQNYQTVYVLSNGVEKTLIFSLYLDESTNYIEGSVIDLTHLQKASKAIKQSEEKYRLIFEESNDAILLLLGDLIIDANRKAISLFNSPNNDLFSKKLFDLSEQLDGDSQKKYIINRSKLGNSRSIKFDWIFSSNVGIIEAEVSLTEILLESKLYYQCVIHNKTEQKKAEKEKLRAEFAEEANIYLEKEIKERINAQRQVQEQFLRTKAILDSSSNTFLITLNTDKIITSFNSHCEKYFGQIFKKELTHDIHFDYYFEDILSPARLRLFKIILLKVLRGDSRQLEVEFIGSEGNKYWMEIFINPIFDINGRVNEISMVSHDISEKKLASIDIIESLKEKEILLKEIHHRVKNNLQVISSILNLQSSFVEDEKTLEILQESRNRIRSMAIIHENLYRTEDFSSIKFGEYLQNLVSNLVVSYRIIENIELEMDVSNVDLILDQAIPCGLLVNELITNSLKYAWNNNEKGKICIKLTELDKMVYLEISDDGVGLPKEFKDMNSDTLGLQLVLTLTDQLDGELNVDINNGTKYLLKFKNIKKI